MNKENQSESSEEGIIKKSAREIIQPFKDLIRASRALWGVNLSYLIEGLTYFGVIGLLAMYFNKYIGLNDVDAGWMVGFMTGGITIAMLILGATVDLIGVRRSLTAALLLMLIGRIILAWTPGLTHSQGMWSEAHLLSLLGMLGIILGYGIYQPAAYAAVRKFTNEQTATMGYAMLYALMNLGGFLPGLISPPVRKAFGITGVFWTMAGLTIVGLIVVLGILTKKTIEKAKLENKSKDEEDKKEETDTRPFKEKIISYIKRFPITDGRFMFFIFILIPVQTLFAHNWLTLPQYCERAFSGLVQENFEFFVNLNPILIFLLTPSIAALTSKRNTYKMMIIGTAVMGISPFILVLGPTMNHLLVYLIIMTIGEAMWQPRFLQWVAEIAPKDMTGIYMGLGQFPWFLTKILTSIYSGWFLMNYCPDNVLPSATNTQTMWLIYGSISISSSIALLLARGWMMKSFKTKNDIEN